MMSRSFVAVAAALVSVAGAAPPATAGAPPTTTTVVLSAAESVYGQSVTATATVTTMPGPAEGDVLFSVDDTVISANIGASGSATAVLPRAGVGRHTVTATFVPADPRRQEPSTSPSLGWVVSPVRTRLQVRVIGRGARIPTSVQVKAAGELGSIATGRVRVVVRRAATGGRTREVARLDSAGVALARLGRLAKGRYRLVVTYVGDTEHRREEHVARFRVRP
jgi:Bacterial Ig-like domain (group 3)